MRLLSLVLPVLLTAVFSCGKLQASDYGLRVGGVAVDSDNALDIASASPNISGHVSFDPNTLTLTLDQATIYIVDPGDDEPLMYGIESDLEPLTIRLVGVNQVFGPLVGIVGRHITLNGTGSLEVEGQGGGIEVEELAVEGGCEVSCGSILRSLAANMLTVNASTLVILNPLGENTLSAFTSLGRVELTDCEVVLPAGAVT